MIIYKNFKRVKEMKSIKLIACLLLAGVSSSCVAGDCVIKDYCFYEEEIICEEEYVFRDTFGCHPCTDYNRVRVEGGYAIGDFIALKRSYGELGLFIAPELIRGWQPFIDLRGFILSNNRGAASGGIGARYFHECSQRISGVNFYYDYQNAKYAGFQWVGLGLESLGGWVDFRLNGHYCLNGFAASDHEQERILPGGFIEFYQLAESPISGIEAEIGYHLFRCSYWSFYGFLGPYYYKTLSDHIYGGYAGLKMDILKNLAFEGLASYDHFYGTRVEAKFLISASFNSLFNLGFAEESNYKDFLAQPVRRHKMLFIRKWM